MVPVFTMSDEEFVACAGFDALTYVRFLSMAVRMAFIITIICCVIVLPVNWAGGTFVDQQLQEQNRLGLAECVKKTDGEADKAIANVSSPCQLLESRRVSAIGPVWLYRTATYDRSVF
jgi:hypothetical protein